MITKFDVGENVWVIYNNTPTEGYITSINITSKDQSCIWYMVYNLSDSVSIERNQKYLFHTKEELIKSF